MKRLMRETVAVCMMVVLQVSGTLPLMAWDSPLSGEVHGWWTNLLHLGSDLFTEDFGSSAIGTDFLADYGGEANQGFQPAPGVTYTNLPAATTPDHALTWTPMVANTPSGLWCDYGEGKNNYVKYWHVYIDVPGSSDRDVTFTFRHDDEIKMWINGVLTVDRGGWDDGTEKSQDGVLFAGINAITIKLAEGGGGDYMAMRVTNRNGTAIDDLTWKLLPIPFLLTPEPAADVSTTTAALSTALRIVSDERFTLQAVVAAGDDCGTDLGDWNSAGAQLITLTDPVDGLNGCVASNLTQKTVYAFRFVITYGEGNDTVWSEPLSFKTLGDIPAVADVTVSDIGGWHATISGVLDEGSLADITVIYGTNTTLLVQTNTVGALVEGASFSTRLDNLLFATDYVFQVVASNAIGTGVSGLLTFRTLGDVPQVTATSLSDIAGRRARLNGAVVAGDLVFVSAKVWEVAAPGTAQTFDYGLHVNGALDLALTGLNPATRYEAQITGTNACGTSLSATLQFMTSAGKTTYYVSADTGDDNASDATTPATPFKSVTRALQEARDDDIIFIGNGLYAPNRTGEVFPMTVPPGVSLHGEDIRKTILHVANYNLIWPWDIGGNGDREAIRISGTTEVRSFTLTGGTNSDNTRGIVVTGGTPLIADVIIKGNDGRWRNAGITVEDDACPTVRNCMLYGICGYDEPSGGIYLNGNSDSTTVVEFCSIFSNTGSGIYKNNTCAAILRNNIIARNFNDLNMTMDEQVECHNNLIGMDVSSPWVDVPSLWVGSVFNNIAGDPQWVRGIYLSRAATGQAADSPCIGMAYTGAGYDPGLAGYTTRCDGVADAGTVDIGFHYPPGNVVGGTVYVATTGNDATGDGTELNPWQTINHALTQVEFGGVVVVAPGTYEEQSPLLIPDGVAVRGDGARTTHAVARNSGMFFTAYGASWFLIEGLTFAKVPSGQDFTSGVYCEKSQGYVRDCHIIGNYGLHSGGGIRVLTASHLMVRNCVIGAIFGSAIASVAIHDSGIVLDQCTVAGNMTHVQDGASAVYVGIRQGQVGSWNRPVTLRDCIFTRNTGVDFQGVTDDMISHCFVGSGQFSGINGCISGDAKMTRWLYLEPGSPCVNAGSRTLGNGEDTGTTRVDGAADTGVIDLGYHSPTGFLPGNDYYVDVDNGDDGNSGLAPGAAFQTMTHALSQAGVGTVISVAPGVYTWMTETFPLRLPNGVAVHGGGMTNTIIDLDGREAGFAIMNVDGVLLEGFTICNSGDFDYSAGVSVITASPMIRNLRSTNNHGRRTGGGIFMEYAAPTVRNCIFDWNWNASADNPGGAITLFRSANVFIENCVFVSNNVVNLPGRAPSLKGRINGGGLAIMSGNSATVRNCIFLDNGDDMDTDGIWDLAVATNGNVYDTPGDSVIEYCNIGRCPPFESSLLMCTSVNPEFVLGGVPEAPYRLTDTSPLIGQGLRLEWMDDATDILGKPRLRGKRVDLGPYQTQNNPATVMIFR